MRKLAIFILILFNTLVATAQLKLSGTLGPYAHNNVCNKYTNINWEVSYKFEKRTDGIYLTYYNQKITVAQNSLYATAEKNYSKSELGLSVWPESYSPASLNVSVNCRLPNGKVELSGFACSTSDPYKTYEVGRICATTLNGQEVSLSAFKLSVTKASYSPQSVQELDNIINQRKGQNMTSGNTSASNTSAHNPLSTTPITTTRATTQDTQRQAYDQAQAAKAAKAELTAQIVTQAGSLVGGLLDDWNAASERKAQRREAERSAATTASVREKLQKTRDRFEFVYLPLMDLAKKGDENARMILYFSSWRLEQESLVPLREQWLEEALTNKNIDALLIKANSAIYAYKTYKKEDENIITDMEKIADMGSVDAMESLANFYDRTGASGIQGGNDSKKALEWYKKAAEKGSPSAMYSLGMIYKYGRTNNPAKGHGFQKKEVVKYDVDLDEKNAFDWFTKSLQPDYVRSIYSKFSSLSYFESDSYLELADFYKKGKVVPKDEAKVSALRVLYENYKYTQSFGYME